MEPRRLKTVCFMMTGWDPGPWRERILHARDDLDLRVWPDIGDPADVDYVLAWKPDPAGLAALPNLRIVFSLGAGVDHILDRGTLPNVPIVRIVDPDLTSRMSEYIVMHALIVQRRFRAYDRLQREGVWSHAEDVAASAVRVGVMGTGVLGADAARKLAMMGFDVAAWGRTAKDLGNIPVHAGPDGLGPFLGRTDILVCLLPLTPDTRGILNRDLFRQLAPDGALDGPHVINAGRGGLQVETDIVAALNDGTLAGATLDVFETEPLPADSPLWRHPNVTLTPHNAAMSDPNALTAYIVRQIERFESGLPLENVVDPQRGY